MKNRTVFEMMFKVLNGQTFWIYKSFRIEKSHWIKINWFVRIQFGSCFSKEALDLLLCVFMSEKFNVELLPN
jgi:hypothetical protein